MHGISRLLFSYFTSEMVPWLVVIGMGGISTYAVVRCHVNIAKVADHIPALSKVLHISLFLSIGCTNSSD